MTNFIKHALSVLSVFLALTHAAPLEPYGTAVGDRLLNKADISVGQAISHSFVFLEHSYNQLYLGTNGYISFDQPFNSYNPTSFPVNGISLLSAFWSGIDFSHDCSSLPGGTLNNNIFYREITDQNSPVLQDVSHQIRAYDATFRSFRAQWVFVLSYSRVIQQGTSCSSDNPANTFQIILATDGRYSFSLFNYNKIEWVSYGGIYAFGGFNRFDGHYFRMLDGSGTANVGNIVTTSNTGVPGRWIFRVDGDTVTSIDCGTASNSRTISISPKYGSVLGGNEIIVSGVCFDATTPTNQIVCKFGGESFPGQQHGPTSVRCVAPTPGDIGAVTLSISVDNGATFPYASAYTFDSTTYSARLVDQHLWESRSDTKLQVQWNPYDIDADLDILQNNYKVAVDLVGWYLSGSDITQHVRTILVPLVPSAINTGRMDIALQTIIDLHQPDFPNEQYTFLRGSLRIMKDTIRTVTINGTGTMQGNHQLPVSLWTPLFDIDFLQRLTPRSNNGLPDAINLAGQVLSYSVRRPLQPLFGRPAVNALAFYKGSETLLSQDQWSRYLSGFPERHQMLTNIMQCIVTNDSCGCWADAERRTLRYDSSDCADFLACPANIHQARLDRARFSAEDPRTSSSACNRIHTAATSLWPISHCAENPGSILCVNAPTVSRQYQQQCCYSDNDNLILANMHPGGGRVKLVVRDRQVAGVSAGLIWLAQRLEEAVTDRLPMKKCCANWNSDSCLLFRDVRKGGTAHCPVPVVPPHPGVGHGDPHIQTYDGFRYTFNGLGEYILLEIPNVITVQGRTARAKSEQGVELQATVWSALAFRVGNITMQIGISSRGDGLHLYVNRDSIDLDTVSSLINLGDSKINLDRQAGTALQKVSAQLALGILVEIEKVDFVIQFEVSLPSIYKNSQSAGLLGRWNDDATDDLLPRGHTVPLHPNSSTQEIFAFGETWRIRKTESLFQYHTPETYETINDLSFRPFLTAPVILNATLRQEAEKLCGANAECMFDVAATGLLSMGQATKEFMATAEEEFKTSRIIVTSCGYPALDESVVIASNSSFNSGESVQLACRNSSLSRISGSTILLCSAEGKWIGEALKCGKHVD
ncbi:uncharacterized protein LOC129585591 [Paramacrobiotus metropolitanus]|uniref:uncharacterized protein LOC129585591 n=1 Tax=Paramacrobiotus metropolitanus TaxID=2943436 RepID=UPI0024458103|nr:uncharacterized protein LOC129585591 [Paramacrobiotus metropolitanus]